MPAPVEPYTIKLWTPHTGTYAAAAAADKIELRAPEFGDSYTFGRVQNMVRTRGGNVITYDYGITETGTIDLQFRNVRVENWNALIAFFNRPTVQWGLTTLAFENQEGTLYKVRLQAPTVTGRLEAYLTHDPACAAVRPLWNFDLKFYDVTSNP